MGKRKYKPSKRKKKQNKNKVVFHGYNGNKYDAEGKEQDVSDDEGGEETFCVYVSHYIRRMKTSSKTEKAKEYLQNFKNKNWKFNKNNQNFILKFILYDKIFPKEYFEIFKEYLVNMHKETKAKFIKSCEDFVQKYKEDIDNAEKLNTMINGHDLKFSDVEKKKEFLNAVHNRCVTLIENN